MAMGPLHANAPYFFALLVDLADDYMREEIERYIIFGF
jgi:hypothetical protein